MFLVGRCIYCAAQKTAAIDQTGINCISSLPLGLRYISLFILSQPETDYSKHKMAAGAFERAKNYGCSVGKLLPLFCTRVVRWKLNFQRSH